MLWRTDIQQRNFTHKVLYLEISLSKIYWPKLNSTSLGVLGNVERGIWNCHGERRGRMWTAISRRAPSAKWVTVPGYTHHSTLATSRASQIAAPTLSPLHPVRPGRGSRQTPERVQLGVERLPFPARAALLPRLLQILSKGRLSRARCWRSSPPTGYLTLAPAPPPAGPREKSSPLQPGSTLGALHPGCKRQRKIRRERAVRSGAGASSWGRGPRCSQGAHESVTSSVKTSALLRTVCYLTVSHCRRQGLSSVHVSLGPPARSSYPTICNPLNFLYVPLD